MSGRELAEDILFVACTRPAMIQGVPLEAFALNAMVTMVIFILAGNPFYMLIGVPVHLACREVCRLDYNMFRLLFLWMRTKGAAMNKDVWGGASVSPLPLRPARTPREVRVHA